MELARTNCHGLERLLLIRSIAHSVFSNLSEIVE
jgi:hypothetical protein